MGRSASSALVGVFDGGEVTIRVVATGGDEMAAELAEIWWSTYRGGTREMGRAVAGHDWLVLDVEASEQTLPRLGAEIGCVIIAGVGVTCPASTASALTSVGVPIYLVDVAAEELVTITAGSVDRVPLIEMVGLRGGGGHRLPHQRGEA